MIKRSEKWLGIFDKRPLIWFHYLLLVGIIFLFIQLSLKYWVEIRSVTGNFVLFLILLILTAGADQLIHNMLKVD